MLDICKKDELWMKLTQCDCLIKNIPKGLVNDYVDCSDSYLETGNDFSMKFKPPNSAVRSII